MAPPQGDFSAFDPLERMGYEDAWETIHSMPGAIEYLKAKDKSMSWMKTTDPFAEKLMKQLKMYEHHSGCSIALTMRAMENIVKYGWESWYGNNK
jgi:hypothetical protein